MCASFTSHLNKSPPAQVSAAIHLQSHHRIRGSDGLKSYKNNRKITPRSRLKLYQNIYLTGQQSFPDTPGFEMIKISIQIHYLLVLFGSENRSQIFRHFLFPTSHGQRTATEQRGHCVSKRDNHPPLHEICDTEMEAVLSKH